MISKSKHGRKPGSIWDYFEWGDLMNSKHFQAICSYCHDPILGVPKRMLNHLKNTCRKIRKEVLDILDNIKLNKKKHKHVRVNTSSSDEDSNITDPNQTPNNQTPNNQTLPLNNNQLIY
ncbi:10375_t:CDS:1 [Cetraspora pellucida]|uniref:10375_t:CDS:1 n=1 Tax=Cetraspora pellucida TaxID=1433469 RepID=A0A9N9A2K4_9GLOM|nr:10375_t:CDS:1 [Cetraspora pellucida]